MCSESYRLGPDTKLYISRCAALFLLAMYLQLLAFQMITHRHLFSDEESDEGATAERGEGGTGSDEVVVEEVGGRVLLSGEPDVLRA